MNYITQGPSGKSLKNGVTKVICWLCDVSDTAELYLNFNISANLKSYVKIL